ncbi:unnamed protein product [Acanthosepion pharaonis]|uniref:Uncharacterized protein n=1 Tax=Acanthosepion pharaonis TaxID=158019 RepID=A0A812CC54_ACAPH|nr:unnamed protein product [Sepia pharaonis]
MSARSGSKLLSCDPARQSYQGRTDYTSAVRVDPLSPQAPTRSLHKILFNRHPGIDWTSNTALPSAYLQAVALKPDNAPSKLHDRTTTNDYLTENNVTAIKIRQRRILKRIGRSDEELLRELFTHVTRGDRTPSQLLRFMRSRLGKHSMSESILRELWMDKLPATITQILASIADNTPLDQLGNSADRIATKLDQGVCAVQRPNDTPAKDTDLEKAVADLQHQLQDIRMHLSRKSRGPAVGDGVHGVPAGIDESTRNYAGTTTDSAPGQRIARHPANTAPKLRAAISMIPPKEQQDRKSTLYKLQAANGSTIETYGTKTLTLNIGMRRDFTWTFTQADVKTPILGQDFLAHYDLAVHMNTRTLSDNTTNISVKGTLSPHNTTGISNCDPARQSYQGRTDYISAVRVDPLSPQAPTRSLHKYRHPGIDWTSNTALPSAYLQAVALKTDNAPSKLHDRTTTNDYLLTGNLLSAATDGSGSGKVDAGALVYFLFLFLPLTAWKDTDIGFPSLLCLSSLSWEDAVNLFFFSFLPPRI